MARRTDLAAEEGSDCLNNLKGIEKTIEKFNEIEVISVSIKTKKAAEILKKPIGKYITLQGNRILEPQNFKLAERLLTKELKKHIRNKSSVLLVGLGNRDITPDKLGPEVANRVVATRHIDGRLKEMLGYFKLKAVSVIAPGVLGQTGMETLEIVKFCLATVSPGLVVVVDALAARDFERLGRTIQITNTGICPGSGVENKRKEISEKTLGVPVLAIGLPTIVDLKDEELDEDCLNEADMLVTPKNIDLIIKRSAKLIANSINNALFPEIKKEEIENFCF